MASRWRSPRRVRRWRRRWFEAQDRLAAAEEKGATDKDLGNLLVEVLSDRPRARATPPGGHQVETGSGILNEVLGKPFRWTCAGSR